MKGVFTMVQSGQLSQGPFLREVVTGKWEMVGFIVEYIIINVFIYNCNMHFAYVRNQYAVNTSSFTEASFILFVYFLMTPAALLTIQESICGNQWMGAGVCAA